MKKIKITSNMLLITLIIIIFCLYSMHDFLLNLTNSCSYGSLRWLCNLYAYINSMIILYLLLFFMTILIKNFKINKRALIIIGIWSLISIFYYTEICQVGWLEFGGPAGWTEQATSTFYCNSITMLVFTGLGESVMFFENPGAWILGILSILFFYFIFCLIVSIYDKLVKKK